MLTTYLNIIGIVLQILGVIVVSRLNIFQHNLAVSESEIPDTYLSDLIDANLTDQPYVTPASVMRHQSLERSVSPVASRSKFRLSLLLVGVGMALQLVAALVALCVPHAA